MPHYGAAPSDWAHLDLILGLGEDLLPVVCRPDAPISDLSKMKAVGKTPSIYNRDRKVAGIANWTSKRATPAEISRWSAEDDYGICIQTRRVRALDIDVDDQELADTIAARFAELLEDEGGELAMRWRDNSGKKLLAFIVEGDMPKRAFKVAGGLVEFLATGQQFVAVGRHTSGAYYQWLGGLPDQLPVISAEVFEKAWTGLVQEFALAPDTEGTANARLRGADLDIEDDVVPWLEAEWETFGFDKGGQLFVACPWKDGHSSDSGETEAAYFPAGTGGYQRGHYRCLHASCQSRTDEEFLDAVGYRASAFEVIDPESMPPGAERAAARREALPPMVRNKAGEIEATVGNLQKALSRPDFTGVEIGYDEFRGQIVLCPDGGEGWRPFADRDYFALRVTLEARGFKPIGREMIRDAVVWTAGEHAFDSASQWLGGLVWDGVKRIDNFLPVYFSTVDTPYTRAIGAYAWTALAGRVLDPGCQADMVPIAVGAQGLRKSSAFMAMAPEQEFYAEFSLGDRDDNLSRKMRGTLIGELAELRGLKSRDAESIKAWITQRREKWTPKYQEFETTFPRRLVFFGSSNPDDILDDDTGNRRWLPFRSGDVDVEGVARDRDQLWAEGAARWKESGVAWGEAEKLAGVEHEDFRTTDTWEDAVTAWLDTEELGGGTPRERTHLTTYEVLVSALGIDARHITKSQEMRVGKVMRVLGFERVQKRVDGLPTRLWYPPVPT